MSFDFELIEPVVNNYAVLGRAVSEAGQREQEGYEAQHFTSGMPVAFRKRYGEVYAVGCYG